MSEEANLAVIEAMWLAWNEKRLNDAADSVADGVPKFVEVRWWSPS